MIGLVFGTSLTLALLTFPPRIQAWGALGHETIAFIAQSHVLPTTKTYVQSILSSSSLSYLASIATWADTYRYTSAGSFSAPYHFIDAADTPPSSCSVDYARDCGAKGCSVSAIQNYTSILLDGSASGVELEEAMKFIVHLVGDIHQPLHDERVARGGNEISVTYDGVGTNLHHIWDTQMVEKLATGSSDGSNSLETAEGWAGVLSASIAKGEYGWDVNSWVVGLNLLDARGTAMGWAGEANEFVCSDVLVGGVGSVQGVDLGEGYYEANLAVVRLQIARAGLRLAKYLDGLTEAVGGGWRGRGGRRG